VFGSYLHFITFILDFLVSTRSPTRPPSAVSSDPKVFQKSMCNIPTALLSEVKAGALNWCKAMQTQGNHGFEPGAFRYQPKASGGREEDMTPRCGRFTAITNAGPAAAVNPWRGHDPRRAVVFAVGLISGLFLRASA
jgi:hypothetical protein